MPIFKKNIIKEIGKHFFNVDIYKELYDLDGYGYGYGDGDIDGYRDEDGSGSGSGSGDKDVLLKFWLEEGIEKNQIPYDFYVPDNFNADDYISTFGIKKNNKYAYLHWFQNSKSSLYMTKKQNITSFNPSDYGILIDNYFDI